MYNVQRMIRIIGLYYYIIIIIIIIKDKIYVN